MLARTLTKLSRWRFNRNPGKDTLIAYQGLMLEIAIQIMVTEEDLLEEREWFVREYEELTKGAG